MSVGDSGIGRNGGTYAREERKTQASAYGVGLDLECLVADKL